MPSLPKVPEEHSQPSFNPLAPPHAALLGNFLIGRKQQRQLSQVGGQSLSPSFGLQIASGSNRLPARPAAAATARGGLQRHGLRAKSEQPVPSGEAGQPGTQGGGAVRGGLRPTWAVEPGAWECTEHSSPPSFDHSFNQQPTITSCFAELAQFIPPASMY